MNETRRHSVSRREFLSGTLGGALALAGCVTGEVAPRAQSTTVENPAGEAWNLEHAVYSGDSISLGDGHDGDNLRSTEFAPDGETMFQLGRGNEAVTAYNLADAWDITTAAEATAYHFGDDIITTEGQESSAAHGLWLPDTGDRMYIWNRLEIYQYDIDSFDVSSAEPVGFRPLHDHVERGHDLDFNPDGTAFRVCDRGASSIWQFALEDPWDVETAVLDYELDISGHEEAIRGLESGDDGRKLFATDTNLDEVHVYEYGDAYDLSTASFTQLRFDVSTEMDNPRSITWRPTGEDFYIMNTTDGDLYRYTIETV